VKKWKLVDIMCMFGRDKYYLKKVGKLALESEKYGNKYKVIILQNEVNKKKYEEEKREFSSEANNRNSWKLPDNSKEWDACKDEPQQVNLLQQLITKYLVGEEEKITYLYVPRKRRSSKNVLAAMVIQPLSVVSRLLSTTTFQTLIPYRLAHYHLQRDLDMHKQLILAIGNQISIECQKCSIRHDRCNTDEIHSLKKDEFMFGPGILSKKVRACQKQLPEYADNYAECPKCADRKSMFDVSLIK